MQKSKERIVSFFDICLTAHSHGQHLDLAPLPLLGFMQQIQVWHAAGQCPKMGRNAAETVYLADISIGQNNGRVDILVNRSDRDASDTVYSNPASNAVRRFPKNAGEGNDYSAHIVINLTSHGNKYEAILEVAPGLASGKISRFLNHLLRHCVRENKAAYQVPHPNTSTNAAGVRTMITAYHNVELTGHPSDEFLTSINGGTLESIELIDRRKVNLIWDTNGNTKEISRSVMLRTGPKANSLNFHRLQEAAALAWQRQYDSARVRFKTANGIINTVMLETENMQFANDTIYVKKEKISGFSCLLEASCQSLHQEIVSKMASLL